MRKQTVVLAALFVVFACKGNEPAATQTTATQSTTTSATTVAASSQPAAAPASTATLASTAASTATTASPAPVLGVVASADGEVSGARIEVMELKRTSGDTVTLKFVLDNNGQSDFGMWSFKLGDTTVGSDDRSVGGIHLVDPVNKKKYFVVRDSEKKCVCSNAVADVHAGQRANLWAKFPAPPADVQKVTIEVPHFQPMDDVPISQ